MTLRQGKLVGYLPGYELGFGRSTETIKKYVRRIPTIPHDASHDEVVNLFQDHPHNKVVVIGDHGQVLGISYSDDLLSGLRKQESSSLYDFAGGREEVSVVESTATKVNFRYKRLMINLATACVAAVTVR